MPPSDPTRRPVRPGPPTTRSAARPPGAGPPIRVQDAAELVAGVPALLGFHPRESLVLIATGGPSGRRIGLTLRADLPPPRHREPVVADVVGALLRDGPAGAAVIVLAAGSGGAEPPHAELAAELVGALAQAGVQPHTAVWAASTAAGAPWSCYGECGCSGVLPDPAGTAFVAAAVAEGQVIHADRAALERLVAPADPERIRRREQRLLTGDGTDPDRSATAGIGADLAAVDAAIAAAAAGQLRLDDQVAVQLATALCDPRVRDLALRRNLGPAATAAEQLWAALARELPDPEAAEPAALLAVAAMLRGDGALANIALDRAERAWPGHRLSGLLRQVVDIGLPPAEFRAWLSGPGRPAAGTAGRDRPRRRPR